MYFVTDPNILTSLHIIELILCLVSEFFISKFSKNPFFGGSYTDPVVGTRSDDFVNLGLGIDRLFFAGELTHPEYYGFVQGALFSGEEKAREIVAIIQNEDEDTFDR